MRDDPDRILFAGPNALPHEASELLVDPAQRTLVALERDVAKLKSRVGSGLGDRARGHLVSALVDRSLIRSRGSDTRIEWRVLKDGSSAIVCLNATDTWGAEGVDAGTYQWILRSDGTVDVPAGAGIFSDAEGDPAPVVPDAAADGTSEFAARRDHVHSVAERTHYEPLSVVSGATPVFDAHGSLGANRLHYDLPDGADTTLNFEPVRVPADYVVGATISLVWHWSNSVGSNNWRRRAVWDELGVGDTAPTGLVANSANIAVAAADTIVESSRDFGTQPAAGDSIGGMLRRIGTDGANDTNTGVTSIWGAWLAIPRDS